jgi:hypothetical protein
MSGDRLEPGRREIQRHPDPPHARIARHASISISIYIYIIKNIQIGMQIHELAAV